MFATVLIQTLIPFLLLTGGTYRQKPVYVSKRVQPNLLVVTSTPSIPVNGAPVLFQAKTSEILKELTGEFLGRQVFFNFDASTGTWYGFGGVAVETAPGRHHLTLEATLLDGNRFSSHYPVTIGHAKYRNISLSVPRQFTEPDEEMQIRINEEKELKAEIFNRPTTHRWWSGPFVAPIDSVVTDPYGTQRRFNGKVQNQHYGTDFKADEGTPIAAMNTGTVVLAREMFYEGGLVVINHGQGLFTLYMHLSKIFVNEGEFVPKLHVIGLSGGTGRATRPHLHVGVRWQGIYVNPESLLKLDLP